VAYKKKQLVTTALEFIVDASKRVYLLGEWCKPYTRSFFWENLSHKVLPFHWDDRDKLCSDSSYIEGTVERLISFYAEKLNEIHNIDWPKKSWRVVLQAWLTLVTCSLFDRFTTIQGVDANCYETKTCDLLEEMHFMPTDYSESMSWLVSNDAYNFLVYSHIIEKYFSHIDQVESSLSKRDFCSYFSPQKKSVSVVVKALYLVSKVLSFPKHWNKNVLFEPAGFKATQFFELLACFRSIPYYGFSNILARTKNTKASKKTRNFLRKEKFPTKNIFERFLIDAIPLLMPTAYIENFEKIRKKTFNVYPKRVKIIFTKNAHYGSEAFKIFSAEQISSGAKLNVIQHGGNCGAGKFSCLEYIDKSVAAAYYTWGWSECDSAVKNSINMPATPLFPARTRFKYNKKGEIVLPLLNVPRYSYWTFCMPVATQLNNHMDTLFELLDKVSPRVKKHINMRVQAIPCWNEIGQRVKDIDHTIKVTGVEKSLIKTLKNSRLCIATYNATSFLEAFTLNIPTMIMWNPNYFELRDEAKPYYTLLEEADILHYDPHSAAMHLGRIFDDPMQWWMQDHVQLAKDEFCQQFAYCPKDSIKIWSKHIKKLLGTENFNK
jgi:putative transferase (TIGR04331 family)